MFLQKKLFEITLGISSFSNIFGTYYIKILILVASLNVILIVWFDKFDTLSTKKLKFIWLI